MKVLKNNRYVDVSEGTISLTATQIQQQCHRFVDELIKGNPNLTHQDCVNVFIFMELAKIQIRASIIENH